MQRHYKLSKIERNEIIGIAFFSAKLFASNYQLEEKNLKQQLSSGRVFSTNQGCKMRNS